MTNVVARMLIDKVSTPHRKQQARGTSGRETLCNSTLMPSASHV